jgi:protein-disulfide isomerase
MKRFTPRLLAIVAVLGLAAGSFGSPPAYAEHDAATQAQKELEEAIHRYLVEHPEVLIEAMGVLQEREKIAEEEQRRQGMAMNRDLLENDPTSPVVGNPEGDVTMVEFFDYQCPYCKRVLPTVEQLIEEDDDLRVVYKEYPILGPVSVVAARVALASVKQDPDRYYELHNALMSEPGRLTESAIMGIAEGLGFDMERLKADMEAPDISQMIDRNIALARSLGINGTPSFVIGEEMVPGAAHIRQLKQLIEKARSSS